MKRIVLAWLFLIVFYGALLAGWIWLWRIALKATHETGDWSPVVLVACPIWLPILFFFYWKFCALLEWAHTSARNRKS